jgi:hypothetical protein
MSFEGADANNMPMAGDFDGDGSSGMGYFGTTDGSPGFRIHQLP